MRNLRVARSAGRGGTPRGEAERAASCEERKVGLVGRWCGGEERVVRRDSGSGGANGGIESGGGGGWVRLLILLVLVLVG